MNVILLSHIFEPFEKMNFGPYPNIFKFAKIVGRAAAAGKNFEKQTIEGIEVQRLPAFDIPLIPSTSPITYGLSLCYKYRSFNGILHAQDRWAGFGFALLKKPVKLLTVRSLYTVWKYRKKGFEKMRWRDSFLKWIEDVGLINSDYLISPTQHYKEEILKNYGFDEEKTFVIPNGVDVSYFKPLNLKKQDFVLFVGNKEDGTKNNDGIATKLAEIINVKFVHGISQKQLLKLYNQALLTIHPSQHENCSKVVLESMSCGTPVIALTTSGGTPELIDNNVNGFLVEKEDFIPRTLELLKQNKRLKEIGKMARKKVLAKFTFNKMVKETLRLYKQIEKNKKPKR